MRERISPAMAQPTKDLSAIVAANDLVAIEEWLEAVSVKIGRCLVIGRPVKGISGLPLKVRLNGVREIITGGSDAARALLTEKTAVTHGINFESAWFSVRAGDLALAASLLERCEAPSRDERKELLRAALVSRNVDAPSWILDRITPTGERPISLGEWKAEEWKEVLTAPNHFVCIDRILSGEGMREDHREYLRATISSFAVLEAAAGVCDVSRVTKMIRLLGKTGTGFLSTKGLVSDASGWVRFAKGTDSDCLHDAISMIVQSFPSAGAELAHQLAMNEYFTERPQLLEVLLRFCTKSQHTRFNLLVYYVSIGRLAAARAAIAAGADINSFGSVTILKQVFSTSGWSTANTSNAIETLTFLQQNGYRFSGQLAAHFPILTGMSVSSNCDGAVLLRKLVECGVKPDEAALHEAVRTKKHNLIPALLEFPTCRFADARWAGPLLVEMMTPSALASIFESPQHHAPPATVLDSLRAILSAHETKQATELSTAILRGANEWIGQEGIYLCVSFGADISVISRDGERVLDVAARRRLGLLV